MKSIAWKLSSQVKLEMGELEKYGQITSFLHRKFFFIMMYIKSIQLCKQPSAAWSGIRDSGWTPQWDLDSNTVNAEPSSIVKIQSIIFLL